MKKLFFVLVLIVLSSAVSMAQNSVILQTGDTISLREVQTFKKYMSGFNFDSGKFIRINYNDVKQVNGELPSYTVRSLSKYHPSIVLSGDAVFDPSLSKISESNYSAGDYLIKAGNSYNMALGLSIVGGGLAILGSSNDTDGLIFGGCAVSIAGLAYYIVGNSNLVKAGLSFKKSGVNVKPSKTGIGLSLNF